MRIINCNIFCPDKKFRLGNVQIEKDIIKEVSFDKITDIHNDDIDAKGNYLVPGFIDIHSHGCVRNDFSDGDIEGIKKMCEYYGSNGITSCLATTMTLSEELLTKAFIAISKTVDRFNGGCIVRGINMEGPYFNINKKGGQNAKYIKNPDIEEFLRLYKTSGNSVKIVDIAPELDSDFEFTKRISKICKVSLAHTEADFDTAINAFDNGVTHVTHLFNAMPPFLHRAPGVVGAGLEKAEEVELICDGIHINPTVIKATFKMFGAERICIISDSLRGCGLEDGDYDLGGQLVKVRGKEARLSDNTIAGSVTNIMEGFRNVVNYGIPIEDALTSVTTTPARAIGIDSFTGSIEKDKKADLVILSKELTPVNVFVEGNIIR